jgi:antitoxin component HigA of HigAB toxin-antitoxin module
MAGSLASGRGLTLPLAPTLTPGRQSPARWRAPPKATAACDRPRCGKCRTPRRSAGEPATACSFRSARSSPPTFGISEPRRQYVTKCHELSRIFVPFWQVVENTSFDAQSRDRLSPVAAQKVLLAHLKASGIKARDLAQATGLDVSMASRVLNGKRGLAVWHLDAVSELLKISVADLFRDLPGQTDGVECASSPPVVGGGATNEVPSARVLANALRDSLDTFRFATEELLTKIEQLDARPSSHTTRRSTGTSSRRVRPPRQVG